MILLKDNRLRYVGDRLRNWLQFAAERLMVRHLILVRRVTL